MCLISFVFLLILCFVFVLCYKHKTMIFFSSFSNTATFKTLFFNFGIPSFSQISFSKQIKKVLLCLQLFWLWLTFLLKAFVTFFGFLCSQYYFRSCKNVFNGHKNLKGYFSCILWNFKDDIARREMMVMCWGFLLTECKIL